MRERRYVSEHYAVRMAKERVTFGPGRLEAFSDGVIAVIITIMVLDLRVPEGDGRAAFMTVVPTLLSYLLSFVFVGLYWLNHHLLMDRLKRVTGIVQWANIAWLFALSLIPFATKYMAEKHQSAFSVQVYSLSMILPGATFLLLRYAADCRAEHEGHAEGSGKRLRVKHWSSMLVYVVAAVIAQHMPMTALALDALVAMSWVLPTLDVLPEAVQEMFVGASGGRVG